MHWIYQIASCHWPCHGGFTAKITGSPIWFVWSTMPWKFYSEDHWFSKYGLYGQPCCGSFTVKITDSPNMVCSAVVNHATEELRHRILYFSRYCLLHRNVREWKEWGKERKDSNDGGNCNYRVRSEKPKSNDKWHYTGWHEQWTPSTLNRWRQISLVRERPATFIEKIYVVAVYHTA